VSNVTQEGSLLSNSPVSYRTAYLYNRIVPI
jgi:hypothetical protein